MDSVQESSKKIKIEDDPLPSSSSRSTTSSTTLPTIQPIIQPTIQPTIMVDDDDDDYIPEDLDDLEDFDEDEYVDYDSLEDQPENPLPLTESSSQPPPQESNPPQLLSQLIKLNLKLYQDNFRLKKFCSNFKIYLEKYCECERKKNKNSTTLESSKNSRRSGTTSTGSIVDSGTTVGQEIHAKYDHNYGNIQWQLFNDYGAIQVLLDKLDYQDSSISDYIQQQQQSTQSQQTPPAQSSTIIEQILFSRTQSLLVKLEHDPSFEQDLLDNLLEGQQIQRTRSNTFNLRPRSGSGVGHHHRLYTCSFCTATFSHVSSLIQHLVREHESILQCFNCNRKFKSRQLFSAHFRTKSCFDLPRAKVNKKQQRNNANQTKVDVKSMHKNSPTHPYNCPHCSLTFKRASYMNNHIKGVHKNVDTQEAKGSKVTQEDDPVGDQDDVALEDNPYYCRLCQQSFDRSIFLVDHIKAFHTENVCVSCNKQFKVRSCLNRHIKESSCGTQHPQRSYPCTFCSFPFKRITHLNQHILRKHSNNPELELIFENYRTEGNDEAGVEVGMDPNSGEKVNNKEITDPNDILCMRMEEVEDFKSQLICTLCNVSFLGSVHFILHLKDKHLTSEGHYQCIHCERQFKSRNTMNRHLKESACYKLATRPYRCRICDKTFKRNNHLNTHLSRVHGEVEQAHAQEGDDEEDLEEEDEEVMEDLDNVEQVDAQMMDTAEDTAVNDVPRKEVDTPGDENTTKTTTTITTSEKICDINAERSKGTGHLTCKWPKCGFAADSVKVLGEHNKLVHLGYNATTHTYHCSKCSQEFTEAHECQKHFRIAHFSARYRCNFNNGACTFETTNLRALREHKAQKHVKIRCYTCDWVNCGKTFVNRSLVAHHIRIVHKNERLHPCVWPGCEQSFKRPINLRHHMATHTGVCNYSCPYEGCEQSFRNPGSLYLHRRRHQKKAAAELENANALAMAQSIPPVTESSTTNTPSIYSCTFPGCDRKFYSEIQCTHHYELDHHPPTPNNSNHNHNQNRNHNLFQVPLIQVRHLPPVTSVSTVTLNSTIMLNQVNQQVHLQQQQHTTFNQQAHLQHHLQRHLSQSPSSPASSKSSSNQSYPAAAPPTSTVTSPSPATPPTPSC